MKNVGWDGVHIGPPGGELEPFFACFSDTWIEGVGRVKLTMEFLDDRLSFVQMANVVFRRKFGSHRLSFGSHVFYARSPKRNTHF